MAKLKNGQTLRKIPVEKARIKPKVKIDWGHKRATMRAMEPESEEYAPISKPSKNGVVLRHGGFQIDDAIGRSAISKFKRPNGTPSYFDVFGKSKPDNRSLGENILILRAWMHLNGHPPISEYELVAAFATLFGRLVLPRRSWPLFSESKKSLAEAFIAEWAEKLYDEVNSGKAPKEQMLLPGWALPDRAALYTRDSIATEQRFMRERNETRRRP